MNIQLKERTAETAAIYFQRTRAPAIQRFLPQKAQTLEEFLSDFRKTQEPGANSYGRTIYVDGQYAGDVWCYCMDPSGDPQAMVSYCLFQQSLQGRGAATEALRLFLDEIRDRAQTELGMVYASPEQIVEYENPATDYVRQLEEIPDDGVLAQSGKRNR